MVTYCVTKNHLTDTCFQSIVRARIDDTVYAVSEYIIGVDLMAEDI